MLAEIDACSEDSCKAEVVNNYLELSVLRDGAILEVCENSPSECKAIYERLQKDDDALLKTFRELPVRQRLLLGIDIIPINGSAMSLMSSKLNNASDLEIATLSAALALMGAGGYAIKKSMGNSSKISEKGSSPTKSQADIETKNSERPTSRQSEKDIQEELGPTARAQVSFKDGKETTCGKKGSVRPDACIGNSCSFEVKNYSIDKNSKDLIRNVSEQAKQRAVHLPQGMQQKIIIDIRGQNVTSAQKRSVKEGIVKESGGIIKESDIKWYGP